jgi:hypothetical protein
MHHHLRWIQAAYLGAVAVAAVVLGGFVVHVDHRLQGQQHELRCNQKLVLDTLDVLIVTLRDRPRADLKPIPPKLLKDIRKARIRLERLGNNCPQDE